jgi:dienelactone hydrolase
MGSLLLFHVEETMRRCITSLLLSLSLFFALPTIAGNLSEYGMRGGDRAKDLVFPPEVTDITFESTPRLAMFKPDGNGPFPALVLAHQCGGLRGNESMLNWAKKAVERGYVVLLLDSLGPRGVDSVCKGSKGDVFQSRGANDALQAARHLRNQPFVDKSRVGYVGFSWGAGNGLLLASNKSALALGMSDHRFDAIVSFYPPCNNYPSSGAYTLIMSGIDRPLLALLGGRDDETPAQECIDGLSPQKESGAPIEWHLYPTATHCWDCIQLNGLRKTTYRGTSVEYIYDPEVTQDSDKRMFDFLGQALKIKK